MPSVNALPEGMIHVSRGYTNEIMEVVKEYHPNAEVTVIPFYSYCKKTYIIKKICIFSILYFFYCFFYLFILCICNSNPIYL
jgi:hypothetical protein